MIHQALETYGSDSAMTSLLDDMDVYVLPVFNVDGYVFSHTSVCYRLFKPYLIVIVIHVLNLMLT